MNFALIPLLQTVAVLWFGALFLPAGTALILPQAAQNLRDGYRKSGHLLAFLFVISCAASGALFGAGVGLLTSLFLSGTWFLRAMLVLPVGGCLATGFAAAGVMGSWATETEYMANL